MNDLELPSAGSALCPYCPSENADGHRLGFAAANLTDKEITFQYEVAKVHTRSLHLAGLAPHRCTQCAAHFPTKSVALRHAFTEHESPIEIAESESSAYLMGLSRVLSHIGFLPEVDAQKVLDKCTGTTLPIPVTEPAEAASSIRDPAGAESDADSCSTSEASCDPPERMPSPCSPAVAQSLFDPQDPDQPMAGASPSAPIMDPKLAAIENVDQEMMMGAEDELTHDCTQSFSRAQNQSSEEMPAAGRRSPIPRPESDVAGPSGTSAQPAIFVNVVPQLTNAIQFLMRCSSKYLTCTLCAKKIHCMPLPLTKHVSEHLPLPKDVCQCPFCTKFTAITPRQVNMHMNRLHKNKPEKQRIVKDLRGQYDTQLTQQLRTCFPVH